MKNEPIKYEFTHHFKLREGFELLRERYVEMAYVQTSDGNYFRPELVVEKAHKTMHLVLTAQLIDDLVLEEG